MSCFSLPDDVDIASLQMCFEFIIHLTNISPVRSHSLSPPYLLRVYVLSYSVMNTSANAALKFLMCVRVVCRDKPNLRPISATLIPAASMPMIF